jgi:hypothetical protein
MAAPALLYLLPAGSAQRRLRRQRLQKLLLLLQQ